MKAGKHSDESWLIFIAALSSNLGLPSDIDAISKGVKGLNITANTTVGEICDKIIEDFKSGALDERLVDPAINQ